MYSYLVLWILVCPFLLVMLWWECACAAGSTACWYLAGKTLHGF